MNAAGPMMSAPFSSTPCETPLGAKSSVMVAVRRWFQTSSNQRLKSWILDSDMVASWTAVGGMVPLEQITAKLIWGRVSLRKSNSKARGKCGRERCARLIYLRFGLGRSHRDEIVEGGEYEFAHCNVKG